MVETRRVIKGKTTPGADLAAEILAKAATAKANPAAFARAAKYAENAEASPRCGAPMQTPEGLQVYRFRHPGDSLTGVLGHCNGQMGYGESTYPIVLDDGSIVCVPGNRRLVRAFRLAKAFHQRIKITYVNRLYSSRGHYEKVYKVEHAPRSGERMTKEGHELIAQAAADAKAKKGAK
jgi:hypothetical protein